MEENINTNNSDNTNENNTDKPSNELNEEYLVSVFKTDNMALIAVVKSILDEAGIKYLAKGDSVQSVVPINAFPVEFQVMPEDETYAKELLSEVDQESDWYDENSPEDDSSEDDSSEGDSAESNASNEPQA
ncbi:MAG: DUF2007 domain-containing protein [Ignavibacteria bacterium]|nr:DUF2007 domain-containing protein [Ignavibacteria bacterium]